MADSELCDIGVIGLAVMGQNLILNMNDHGFKVAAFNRTTEKVDEFLAGPAQGTQIFGAHSIEEFVASLKKPRRAMLMVKAGGAVDAVIEQLLQYLEPGDIIIDGGNSLYTDTERRVKYLEEKEILFLGTGISGGEDGARHGPSIMPGGSTAAWPHVKELFQAIAAKAPDGSPCCEWVGEGGAGHYVKMVHNGIEYGDMQLIAESYQLLRDHAGMSASEIGNVFAEWNKGELDSYLIEITADILQKTDVDGAPLVDHILDRAGQKGTGAWTVISAAELGQPVSLVSEAVFARSLSALKEERVSAAEILVGPKDQAKAADAAAFATTVGHALYAAKIVSYAQGFMLLRAAAAEHNWNLEYGNIALLWRGGCIIRSRFLGDIKSAYDRDPALKNLLLDSFFADAMQQRESAWRDVIVAAVQAGIPVPGLSSGLSFYDGYRSATVPANLIQAQRDYFGAHTYERTDKPRGEMFHTDWIGDGKEIANAVSSH